MYAHFSVMFCFCLQPFSFSCPGSTFILRSAEVQLIQQCSVSEEAQYYPFSREHLQWFLSRNRNRTNCSWAVYRSSVDRSYHKNEVKCMLEYERSVGLPVGWEKDKTTAYFSVSLLQIVIHQDRCMNLHFPLFILKSCLLSVQPTWKRSWALGIVLPVVLLIALQDGGMLLWDLSCKVDSNTITDIFFLHVCSFLISFIISCFVGMKMGKTLLKT